MSANKREQGRDGSRVTRLRAARPVIVSGVVTLVLGVILAGVPLLLASPTTTTQANVTAGSGWVDYDSQPLRVNIWHDKDQDAVYRYGEPVRIHFEINQDAYAVVYRIDSEGNVTVLWPRSRYDDGFVFSHHEYLLPAAGADRLRAGDEAGIEYVEAVVAAYPFDLRNLEVGFHHEANDDRFAFQVAGDPFLAMNEINYAVTGLEDPADYVVTDYTSYYVHEQVDHPRYLCGQCHDEELAYHPYHDTCAVEIHYDYGWSNRWYLHYGYYPVYYYPAFYYVDPWTWRPWVNYWYTPWYFWPTGLAYSWSYPYYCWYDSPYYRGDIWVSWKGGNRRYTPLAKDYRSRAGEREDRIRRRNQMVKGDRPSEEMKVAMRNRSRLDRREAPGVKGSRIAKTGGKRSAYRDTKAESRVRTGFRRTEPKRSTPGLRIRNPEQRKPVSPGAKRSPGLRTGGERFRLRDDATVQRKGSGSKDNGSRTGIRDRSGGQDRSFPDRSRKVDSRKGSNRKSSDRKGIRSVEPRKQGSRIWSGGSSAGSKGHKARPQQVKPSNRGKSGSSGKSAGSRVTPSRKQSSNKSAPARSVKPRSSTKSSGGKSSSSRGSSRSSSSGGSRNSSGKSRSGGGGKR